MANDWNSADKFVRINYFYGYLKVTFFYKLISR